VLIRNSVRRHVLSVTAGALSAFLLLAQVACVSGWSLSDNRASSTKQPGTRSYKAPVKLTTLQDDAVKESSGVAASASDSNVYWTHNDSGDGPFLYAFDRQGRKKGVWKVKGASAVDWEDIAIGPGPVSGKSYIYIGDTGDNSLKRRSIIIYRIPEPAITAADASSSKSKPVPTEPAEAMQYQYPDGPHDCEALLVHPTTGDIYLVTKAYGDETSTMVFRVPKSSPGKYTLERVGEVKLPSLFGVSLATAVTGGDISPDGRRVILCGYLQGYEFLVPDKSDFDAVWKQSPTLVDLGPRSQGEGVCYRRDGKALIATTEGRPSIVFEVPADGR
jgi:hypothetical protein